MSLLDRLLEAQDAAAARDDAAPPRRASAWAGPSILTSAQLRAMERALERELPGHAERMAAARLEAPEAPSVQIAASDLPDDFVEAAIVPFVSPTVQPAVREPVPDLLPVWSPPQDLPPAVELLPVWSPPSVEPRAELEPVAGLEPVAEPAAESDACPNCGEELAISRIDLTANASWLSCRACGLRWGGSIGRERGHVAAG